MLGKPLADIQAMKTREKRELLMDGRKGRLEELIQAYYRQRGWTTEGLPAIETLERLGLWKFLNEETRARMLELHRTKQAAAR